MSKILSLDDSRHFRLMIQTLLVEQGHEVICLDDWSTLAGTIRREQPDLLLLDLNMPLPGENVAAVVRKFYHDLPIIFVSGESMERLQRAVSSMGAVGFVTKDATFKERLPEQVAEVLAEAARATEQHQGEHLNNSL